MIIQKITSTYRALLLGCAVCLGVGGLTVSSLQAEEVTPPGFSRVYINLQTGGKGAVVSAVAAAGGRVHYEFDGIGAIAASIPDQALAGLARNPNVSLIEPDPKRFLLAETTPYGVTNVQADSVWSLTGLNLADGSGVIVGVIDSGIYRGHEDFAVANLDGYPKQLTTTVRITGGGPPRTDTVTKTLSPDDDEEYWGRDFLGHGTHVSGTITAVGNNSKGVVGVSPGNVKIFMVKVFGDTGNWVYSSSLVNAAQQAKNNGAQIISMSLGGEIFSATEESGMNQLYSDGLLLVAAAGNNGKSTYSYPASYDSVISVGAVDSAHKVADFSQKNTQVELAAPGVGVLSTVPYAGAQVTVNGTDYSANGIENSATTTSGIVGDLVHGGTAESAPTDGSWNGKVVLVERGINTFDEKVSNVESAGGKAAVIYNNEPGNFLGTLGTGNSSTIPAVSISQADGTILSAAAAAGSSATVNNQFKNWESGYQAWDGTSMATPHVSGVAALLLSAYPGASNQNIRDAMAQSARDLGTSGRDDSYGYGLVQAKEALFALRAIIVADTGGGGSGPLISNIGSTVTNARKGSFQIHWNTGTPASSDVYISGSWYKSSQLVTSHVEGFRGPKGETYLYAVSSTDADGNTTVDDNGGKYYEHKN